MQRSTGLVLEPTEHSRYTYSDTCSALLHTPVYFLIRGTYHDMPGGGVGATMGSRSVLVGRQAWAKTEELFLLLCRLVRWLAGWPAGSQPVRRLLAEDDVLRAHGVTERSRK